MRRNGKSAGSKEEPGLVAKIVGTLFFGAFFAMGVWVTGLMLYGFFRGATVYTWDKQDCLIVRSEVEEHPDAEESSEAYRFKVLYTYLVSGQRYSSDVYRRGYTGSSELYKARTLADRYPPRSHHVCFVDPEHPSSAVLQRPTFWGVWAILFPLLFVVFGGFMIVGLWKSDKEQDRFVGRFQGVANRIGPQGCLVLFFSVFFLAGAGFSLFFVQPALKVLAARSWQPTPCTILSSQVRTHSGDDGSTYSVDVLFAYTFNGREYKSNRYQFLGGSTGGYAAKERIVRRLPPQTRTECYVDPDEPSQAVLNRDFGADYLFGLVPLLFVGVGLGGMIFAIRGRLKQQP